MEAAPGPAQTASRRMVWRHQARLAFNRSDSDSRRRSIGIEANSAAAAAGGIEWFKETSHRSSAGRRSYRSNLKRAKEGGSIMEVCSCVTGWLGTKRRSFHSLTY